MAEPSFSNALSSLSSQVGYGIRTGIDGQYNTNKQFALKIGADYLFTTLGDNYSDSAYSFEETVISQFFSFDANAIYSLNRFQLIGGLGIDIPINAISTSSYTYTATTDPTASPI